MGRYTDGLEHRVRARRGSRFIKHPPGFKGMVMWCSSCRAEVLRSPSECKPTMKAQRAALDAHNRVCKLRHLQPRPIPQPAPVRARRRRWPWLVLMIVLVLAATVVWRAR